MVSARIGIDCRARLPVGYIFVPIVLQKVVRWKTHRDLKTKEITPAQISVLWKIHQ